MNRRSQSSQPSPSVSEPSLAPNIPTSDRDWHYETAVAEIEDIITQIESGELELAEVFDQFAVAIKQIKQCEAFLTQHQQQMDLMVETLVDEPEDEEF